MQNNKKPHTHKFHLPRFMSYSGQKPSKQARISFVIVAVILVACQVDLLVTAVTVGRVMPGVSIAGNDVSYKTRSEVYSFVKKHKLERNFDIKVGDKTFKATNTELGAKYDLVTTADTAYSVGRSQQLVFMGIAEASKYGQIGYAYSVDQERLKSFTTSIIRSIGKDATNASLKIENGVVVTLPDSDGLRVDQQFLNRSLATALSTAKDQNLSLQPQTLKASILASQTTEAKAQAEKYLQKSVVLSYNGKTYYASKEAIGYMIVFNEVLGKDGKPTLVASISREQIAGYVQSVANQINISPKNKKVVIANGTSTVEREGSDGLAINQSPAIDAITAALQEDKDVSFGITASPVAFKTETFQIGGTGGLSYGQYIEISISRQRLWAWQDGQVVFTTAITSGAAGDGFPTLNGLFSIYAKERSRYLNGSQYGWSYNVYVDYWMPFNGGQGLHDADWRSSFGGQDYYYGGSHGCVNMPKSSAAFLYGWATVGTPVWVHT